MSNKSTNPLDKWSPLADEHRLALERVTMVMVLPAVAGGVNACGFMELGFFSSHMTGNATRIGDSLARGSYFSAAEAFAWVLEFCGGAMLATLLVELAQRRSRARYSAPLLLEMGALTAFSLLCEAPTAERHERWMAALLCYAMGSQNALVTQISGAVVRTTHLTGIFTDTAIELTRLLIWAVDSLLRPPQARERRPFKALFTEANTKRLALHLTIIASFLFGTFLGPKVYFHVGPGAMILPLSVLGFLAVFDTVLGIRGQPH